MGIDVINAGGKFGEGGYKASGNLGVRPKTNGNRRYHFTYGLKAAFKCDH